MLSEFLSNFFREFLYSLISVLGVCLEGMEIVGAIVLSLTPLLVQGFIIAYPSYKLTQYMLGMDKKSKSSRFQAAREKEFQEIYEILPSMQESKVED